MKSIIALFCSALLSFSVFASSNQGGNNGSASERGPWVECHLSDGTSDYVPSGVCKEKGGL
ncbi:hypothetical protein [Vibrio sp. LaRot3]|uniref:hypothetical protein n=1 Tax=Vibrio sp. LaRot3 TaxID=2998829 RepID=UPI0022CDF9C3|nr:hypothetical protein [Vibrio sp. LaRot3]MDA0146914.1 hypothetical protein [Vibrio sp. LaRot3]